MEEGYDICYKCGKAQEYGTWLDHYFNVIVVTCYCDLCDEYNPTEENK